MRPLVLTSILATLFTSACNTKTAQQTRTTTSNGETSTAPSGKSAAARDQALVRFVNADPRTASADLWFGDRSVASNIQYKGVTPYAPLPDDRGTFRFRAAGSTAD